MPQHPTARPSPTRTVESPAPPVSAPDLTLTKVLAGAGAAATSAVLGSFFGAAGTLSGAALGSVASTVATTLYQRSLDRTRDRLVARIRTRPGPGARATGADVTIPMQRVSPETVRLRARPVVRPPRRWGVWVLATVVVFALGLLAVTGLEWAKGSTLTAGESGTSVGRVLSPDPPASPAEDTGPVVEPSTTPEPTVDPSAEATTPPPPSTDPDDGLSGTVVTPDDAEGTGGPTPTRQLPIPLGE